LTIRILARAPRHIVALPITPALAKVAEIASSASFAVFVNLALGVGQCVFLGAV
jgi:hypothetical protein